VIGTVESDKCSLAYKIIGSGEAAVFIQGVGLHGDGWLPQTNTLKSDYCCVTFDNRGMGRSQPAGTVITVEKMAEDVVTVMDAAGIRIAHLIGHSLGGSVALQVALTARHRVRSLSLLCTSARGSDATRLTPRMLWLGARCRIGTRRMRYRAFLEIVMPATYLAVQNRDALAKRLMPLFGHDLGDTPAMVTPQLRALQRFDATDRLPMLAGMPALVLSAAHDIIFPPACGKQLASGIPGARYVEMAGAAHGVTIQAAEDVNRILLEHFRSASG